MENKIFISANENRVKELSTLENYLKQFYVKNHKMPSFDNICNSLGISKKQLIPLLRELEKLGKIKRKYSQYDIPSLSTKIKKKKIDKQVFKKLEQQLDNLKMIFIKTILSVVGLIAAYMSIYFTTIWFNTIMSKSKSIMMSLSMIGFSIAAFEIIILFRQNKKRLYAFIFGALFLIVLVFSMISTIAGQLNLQREKINNIAEENIQENNDILLFNEHNASIKEFSEQINDLKIDILSKREERKKLLELLNNVDSFEGENKKQYNDINYRIYLKNKDLNLLQTNIKLLQIKINEKQIKKEKLLSNNVKIVTENKKDFYEWVSDLLKIDKNLVMFILFLFPAIFIDIIAPLCFAVVLFYKEEESVDK